MHFLTCVDEVLEQREVRRASDKAPRAPIAGASTVAMFHEKLQAASRVMDIFSKNPLVVPARTNNPHEAWDPFCNSRIEVFVQTQCFQKDEGGE